jgi:hypothetical protein
MGNRQPSEFGARLDGISLKYQKIEYLLPRVPVGDGEISVPCRRLVPSGGDNALTAEAKGGDRKAP